MARSPWPGGWPGAHGQEGEQEPLARRVARRAQEPLARTSWPGGRPHLDGSHLGAAHQAAVAGPGVLGGHHHTPCHCVVDRGVLMVMGRGILKKNMLGNFNKSFI